MRSLVELYGYDDKIERMVPSGIDERDRPQISGEEVTVQETLDSYFPINTFLAPRVWEGAGRWFPSAPGTIEFVTGHSLSCAGRMPIISHRSTLSPPGLAAMADAGVRIAEERFAYSRREEYIDHVRALTGKSLKAVTPFWTPAEVVPSENTWIDGELLQYLNNKSNMPQLVPRNSLPQRQTVVGDCAEAIRTMVLPKVLKVGTNLPNGGGEDMMICRLSRHKNRAVRRFDTGEHLVIEELLEITENYCVQYSVRPDGSVTYLGASTQICLPNGAHAGNLLDPADQPPGPVLRLGDQIAMEGGRLGFSGIAGFDIVVTQDGRVLAIDLNFRLVSSTAQVLLHPRLSRERRLAASRLAFCSYPGRLDEMLKACRPGIDKGWLVPLATYDPAQAEHRGTHARCRLLLFGDTPAEIAENERSLYSRGVEVAGRSARGRTIASAARLFKQVASRVVGPWKR